jgi:hypothetical protein
MSSKAAKNAQASEGGGARSRDLPPRFIHATHLGRHTRSMRPWIAVVSVCWVTVALFEPAPADSMSCAATVVVDGYVLFGTARAPHPERLPEHGASLRAIEPACGDDDHDREVTVTAFRGIPPSVAVASTDAYSSLYIAPGALVALAKHPLHRVWYADANRPSARRGRSCREAGRLTGTVMGNQGFTGLALRTPRGEQFVRVDAQSRIANRPAYQPALAGQRLTVGVLQCERDLVAERIRFVGATVRPQLTRIRDEGNSLPVILAAIATVLVGITLIFKLTR